MPPPLLSLPSPLRSGDRVWPVAASSALEGRAALDGGIAVLRSWDLEVEERAGVEERRWGYLAGRDRDRAADFQPDGSRNPELLACARGGWGAARLLEGELLAALDASPNGWLLGFSDVTTLLWARVARRRPGALHGPLLTTLASEPPWSQERLRSILFGEPVADLEGQGWQGGVAEGPLLAANLTVATHLLGTPHLPDLSGAILILEDVGEAPYRIERMLTHWRLCGALQRVSGIGFGSFEGCDAADSRSQEPTAHRFSVEQVLRERTADLAIPVVANLPVGHAPGNAALPLGVPCRLDGDRGLLSLLPC